MKINGRSALVAVISAWAVLMVSWSRPAHSSTLSARTSYGKFGQQLSVSKTLLSASGSWVSVQGKNFDERVGIYIALCLKPKKGDAKPWPHQCGGGVNKSGSSRASAWISSNPPPYGVGLVTPYGFGGTFKVKLFLGPRIGQIDCRKVTCFVTAMADHVSLSDRSADIFIPVTFR